MDHAGTGARRLGDHQPEAEPAEPGRPPAGMRIAHAEVLDSHLAYVEGGTGRTVLFLHGNPTSSFLWRRVLDELTGVRCIAVDLIGMGRSGKPDIDYTFADHARHLEAFADRLGLRDAVVVGHDWGAVLGLDLAHRRPDIVGAIAICEGHLHPVESWQDMDAGSRELFRGLRSPGTGERLVLEDNVFVEQVLPSGMHRTLTTAERDAYRAPFGTPRDRRPILAWIRQIPIAGEPAEVANIVRRNQRLLLYGPMPRMLLYGAPGAVVGAAEVAWCRREAADLTMVNLGAGTHFLPEDQPHAIAEALADWV